MGEDIVQQWRAGLHARPPVMSVNHIHWHGSERKYANLDPSQIPVTESLQASNVDGSTESHVKEWLGPRSG